MNHYEPSLVVSIPHPFLVRRILTWSTDEPLWTIWLRLKNHLIIFWCFSSPSFPHTPRVSPCLAPRLRAVQGQAPQLGGFRNGLCSVRSLGRVDSSLVIEWTWRMTWSISRLTMVNQVNIQVNQVNIQVTTDQSLQVSNDILVGIVGCWHVD